jgi:hypothetical protein
MLFGLRLRQRVGFIAENGGGAGVRLRKAGAKVASIPIEDLCAGNDE